MDGVVLWIRSNQDVIDVYKKTKTECNYLHRSDNEFLMFLLEAAANVISIVHQFSPQMKLTEDMSPEPAPIVTTTTTEPRSASGDEECEELYPEPEPDMSLQDISHHVNELESVLESLNTGCSPAHDAPKDVPIKPAPNRSFLERYKANNIPSFTQYSTPAVKQREKQPSSIPNVTIRAESELNMYTNKDALYTGKDLGKELCKDLSKDLGKDLGKEANKETQPNAFSAAELQKSSTAETQQKEKEEEEKREEGELKRKAEDTETSVAKKSTIKTEPTEPETASETREQPIQSSSTPHPSSLNLATTSTPLVPHTALQPEDESPDLTQCELDLTSHLMSVIQSTINNRDFLTSQPSMLLQQSSENYVCLHCKQNFANERNLRRHVLTHTSQENYNCPHCAFMTTRRPYLAKHISTVHSRDRTSSILHCDQCEYKTPTKSHLRNHMLAHSGNRQYQCPHCTYNSNFSNALTRHMTMHSRDPPLGDS